MNSSDTTSFDNYAEELIVLFKEIETILNSNSRSVHASTTLLQQCQDVLQQMSVEARSAENAEQRRLLMEQYRIHKKQYDSTKQLVEKYMLVNPSLENSCTLNSPHPSIVSTEQNLVKQNTIVSNSLKSIHETEQVALETMEHLQNQRNTLEHTRDNTKSLQSLTQQANQIATNLLKPWWRKGV